MSSALPSAIQNRDLRLDGGSRGVLTVAIVADILVSVLVIIRIYVVRTITQVFYVEDCEFQRFPPPLAAVILSP